MYWKLHTTAKCITSRPERTSSILIEKYWKHSGETPEFHARFTIGPWCSAGLMTLGVPPWEPRKLPRGGPRLLRYQHLDPGALAALLYLLPWLSHAITVLWYPVQVSYASLSWHTSSVSQFSISLRKAFGIFWYGNVRYSHLVPPG